ncbi:MAG: methylaspartate mutase subunit E [Pseudomonadota bacterium]
MKLSNERWSDEYFKKEREKALALWPTGKEVDTQEAVAYHLSLPDNKNYAKVVRKAKQEGRTLVQPRGGVAIIEEHIRLLRCLQDDGGADLLPTTTDTYTRNMKFHEAQRGIDESIKAGRSMLNGLPVVNYGPGKVRRVVDAVDRPIMALSGTPYPRLTSEITIAAGFSGYLGAGISYPCSYIKTMTFEEGIKNYQYLDRLCSYYAEQGVVIHREQPGFLTGTLIPPGIGVAVGVLETLLAAGQGVRHYSVGLTQNLDIAQDVAALRVYEDVCQHYLKKTGINDMFISVATHQWMQAFPTNESEAFSVIVMGAIIAVLGGATQVITKTSHEAIGIPTMEANAAGVRATRKAIAMMRKFRLPLDKEIRMEMEMIRCEAIAIVDKALELGDGDVAVGVVRAFEAGTIDIPWAPNIHTQGAVIPVRDGKGAVRYLRTGHLPFGKEIIEYNAGKIKEREEMVSAKADYEMACFDILEICKSCV